VLSAGERLGQLERRPGTRRPVLIVNPRAGQKLGVSVNPATQAAVTAALTAAGIDCDVWPTAYAGHATELARQAVAEHAPLVIAAGGDGTLLEVAVPLAGTETVLGIMPLGSVMNTARTLCVPRELDAAARTIADGRVLAMDLGQVHGRLFLEAGGVGLAAGLFSYFDRLDSGARPLGTLRAGLRFVRGLGSPRLLVDADGVRRLVRSPMVTVSNGPFVGAAYAIAPDARIDDGWFDVVIFRGIGPLHVLAHLALMAGGRRFGPPPEAETFRARRVTVRQVRRRPLPVHADGAVVGATPATFEILPAALNVIVGAAAPGAECAFRAY
jgi:diacylglycerol kinase (ATP)